MNLVDGLFSSIKRGHAGLNQGLSTGMPKLDSLTFGIQRKWFTVIAGDSGSGKSMLTLFTHIYNPFKQYMKDKTIDVHFLIFSFEMSSEVLLAKLLSMHLYDKYHKVISYEEILSLTSPLTNEDLKLIESERSWLDELEKRCTIIDKAVNAKGLYAVCKEWSKQFGTYEETPTNSDYIKEDYVPHNPQQYLIAVVDHIKLLQVSAGHTSKQEIDEACDYLIHFRNKCSFTVAVVQQLNRNFKGMDRRTGGYNLLQLDDLSDSSGPAQAAEVVIGIFHPFREKMSKCEGYNIVQLRDRFRLLQILKQRFGLADRSIGCAFYGEVSHWKDMPLPDKITDNTPYLNP